VELLFFRDPAVSFLAAAGLTLALVSRMTSSGAAKTLSKMDVTTSTVKMETRGDQRIVRYENRRVRIKRDRPKKHTHSNAAYIVHT
jgi:protein tyrosine phosphatase